MSGLRVALVIVAVGAAALAALSLASPDRAALDVVAAGEEKLGIELRSSRVETNGIRLHVVEAGPADGTPVVLLHGFPEFWWAWIQQIGDLAGAGFRVLAVDQRGYNESDKPPDVSAYRRAELVADIAGLIRGLDDDRVLLAGHDWGGRVAWDLALAHPELIAKLAIFNMGHPTAFEDAARSAPEETVAWFRTFFQVPWLPEHLLPLGDWAFPARFLSNALPEGAVSDIEIEYYKRAWARSIETMIYWYRANRRHPVEPPADPRVRVPTLIVWGLEDRFLDSRLPSLSAKYCDDAEVVELPDTGHFVMHEKPDLASQLLIAFFSS